MIQNLMWHVIRVAIIGVTTRRFGLEQSTQKMQGLHKHSANKVLERIPLFMGLFSGILARKGEENSVNLWDDGVETLAHSHR